ncbi:hypothetical protein VSQ48_11345 [Candidatus Ventrimonas sp. KK005]
MYDFGFEIDWSMFWMALATIAAIAAAIFAGLTWKNAEKSLEYAKTKEAPDLWMKKDKFIYGEYEITQLSQWNQPMGIPPETVVLQHFPVMEKETKNHLNRMCVIFNSSKKHSSNAHIDNYTGLFGELYFENRGLLPIKEIEMTKCHFKMRKNNDYDLEDFTLKTLGKLDVDIRRDSQFIIFIGYLFDNDNHLLCDPKYSPHGILIAEAIVKKKMYNDQLRCYLPVMIDLYDELTFTFKFTSQDGSVYTQKHTIKIELNGNGGIYTPTAGIATLIK